MPVNRVVVLLTPVFAALAGWVVQLAARYLPGTPHLDSANLTALFVAGATAGLTAALGWLHGHQKHEAQRAASALAVQTLSPAPAAQDLTG